MELRCPRTDCQNTKIYQHGRFWRKSDSRWIACYRCPKCAKRFSSATFDPCYRQKKRFINGLAKKLLSSLVSQRRSALIMAVARKTIERRVRFFGQLAKKEFVDYWKSQPKAQIIYFDELETFEHTKCKPLSVAIAVSAKRQVMGIELSRMPAKGYLAAIARKKYGFRADERMAGLARLMESLKNKTTNSEDDVLFFHSDDHPFYPPTLKKYFPSAHHLHVNGGRSSSVAGQGELKKKLYDPLFKLNHTFAMFRANINRLIRKTWCTTKDPARLLDHLYLYANFHNQKLLKVV